MSRVRIPLFAPVVWSGLLLTPSLPADAQGLPGGGGEHDCAVCTVCGLNDHRMDQMEGGGLTGNHDCLGQGNGQCPGPHIACEGSMTPPQLDSLATRLAAARTPEEAGALLFPLRNAMTYNRLRNVIVIRGCGDQVVAVVPNRHGWLAGLWVPGAESGLGSFPSRHLTLER
jgi:hypothetical protein